MRKWIAVGVALILTLGAGVYALADSTNVSASTEKTVSPDSRRILIAYFSRAGNITTTENVDATSSASINLINGEYVGNTELLARWIQEQVGGDLFLITTAEPYSPVYDETVEVGEAQNQEDIHPALSSHVENMDEYDLIFLGYPVWNYDAPVAIDSFLEAYDLSGKTVIPFSTSGGSDVSAGFETIERYQPDITLLEGITVSHRSVLDARDQVNAWLAGLGF